MPTKLDLVPLTVEAKKLNISTKRLLRKLRAMEQARGHKFIYGGGKHGVPYQLDRAVLEHLHQGFALEDRVEKLETRVKQLEYLIRPE